MSNRWSAKQKRQFYHIFKQLLIKDMSVDEAKKLAAKTVNSHRGKKASSVQPFPQEETIIESIVVSDDLGLLLKDESKSMLYAIAKELKLAGRSKMNRAQLTQAIVEHEQAPIDDHHSAAA